VQEAVMALLVEARYDKDAILESYLNEIYLGQRGATAVHGVGEGAHLFFGKPAAELSVAESALIAAIIQSPTASPHQSGRAERDHARLMREQGRITEAQLEEASAEPVRVSKVTPEPRDARFFLDALRRQLPAFYSLETLTSEGLRIYATLDLRLQRLAASALREELAELEKRYLARLQEGLWRVWSLGPRPEEVRGRRRDYRQPVDRCPDGRPPEASSLRLHRGPRARPRRTADHPGQHA
jgi:penicillin-binding protein 1B